MIFNYDKTIQKIISPTIVLSTKSYKKLGVIQNAIPTVSINDNAPNEMTFRVYRYLDDVECKLWNKINNLKLVWFKENNEYYEIKVQPSEDGQEYKDISCTSLCEAELSQIKIYNIEINTEADVLRDEYIVPTVFYNENNVGSSLLHRIFDKAPHYKIGHVDDSLKKLQRSFSFDDTDIYSALNEISQEIGCIFKYDTTKREVNVYDLYQYCHACGMRNDTSENVCPECGSKDVVLSYGKRTNVFFSTENVIEDITIEYNIDEYKNCFKLKSGDELFDATIRNINPNGTDYIYNITKLMEEDMSNDLQSKLNEYNNLYNGILTNYSPSINEEIKKSYNTLIKKYNDSKYANYQYDENANRILDNNDYLNLDNVRSYDDFANVYYDAIDFATYLESKLMPVYEIEETSAQIEIEKLTNNALSPVSLSTLTSSTSKNTVENAIKNFSQLQIFGSYKVEIITSSYDYKGTKEDGTEYGTWNGSIKITRYGNAEDTATTGNLNIEVNDDYKTFLEQKINKSLVGDDNENEIGSAYNVLAIELDEDFKDALTYYGEERLKSFKASYQSGLDVLIEMGYGQPDSEFYDILYTPYKTRQTFIEEELLLRASEVELINEVISLLEEVKSELRNSLDIESYLGKELWLEFCAYRREDTYQNENYISDGLDNAQLIENATQFFNLAKKDLYKSGKVGISISGNLITFMSIEEFLPILEYIDTGIWVKVKVLDEIYTVRLSNISVNFEDLNNSSVTFTDVIQEGKSPTQKLLDSMKSISTSFSNVKHQVDSSKNSIAVVESWVEKGLDLTNQEILSNAKQPNVIYDKNGILLTSLDDITEQVSPEQIKMTNATIAITEDAWETVSTAVGKFMYIDPVTGERKVAFGVNGKVIVGSLLLGEQLGIYTEDNSLTFDKNSGLVINATKNEDGTYDQLFNVSVDGKPLIYIDEQGNLKISNLSSLEISFGETQKQVEEQKEEINKLKNKIYFTLESNYAHTQVYDKGIKEYIPDYSKNPLTIAVTSVRDGVGNEITPTSITWTRQGGSELLEGEVPVDNTLLVARNLEESVTYVCTVAYDGIESTNSITITRVDNGVDGLSGSIATYCKINTTSMNFISSDGYVYTPNEITLKAYCQGCTYLKWMYSVDAIEWLDAINVDGLELRNEELIISKSCPLFTNTQKNIHFKLLTDNENVYDVITISKLKDGLNGRRYELEIVSSHGNIFKNGRIETTLEAVLYEYGEVATANYNDNHFIWTRVSYNEDSDRLWNSANAGGTKIITITGEDVHNRATFFCDFIDTTTRMSLL